MAVIRRAESSRLVPRDEDLASGADGGGSRRCCTRVGDQRVRAVAGTSGVGPGNLVAEWIRLTCSNSSRSANTSADEP